MTQIRYDILYRNGGWCIACNDTIGPPYNRRSEATRDVLWIADLLRGTGNEVEVFVDDDGHAAQLTTVDQRPDG